MLDDPERTSRLLAALEAALPFEVHLTPPLARLLREQQVVLPAGDRPTVSGGSYLGDEGGIVPPDGREVAFVSLTHVRVPPPMPLAAEVLRYQKHRVKKLTKQGKGGEEGLPPRVAGALRRRDHPARTEDIDGRRDHDPRLRERGSRPAAGGHALGP